MACRSAALLESGTKDRVADIVSLQHRANGPRLFGSQPFVIDAVGAVGVYVTLENLHVVHRMREHHDAALREHDVVVEVLGESLPHLQGVVIEGGALVAQDKVHLAGGTAWSNRGLW